MEDRPTPLSDEVIQAYFQHCLRCKNGDSDDEEFFWAWEEVDEVWRGDPEYGWSEVLRLLDAAPSKYAIAWVAVGPLEDLIKKHGNMFIPRIETEASTNKRFLYALTRIYFPDEEPAYSRLEALMHQYDVKGVDPLPDLC